MLKISLLNKTREKIIQTLSEEDDYEEMDSDHTLKRALDEFCAALFGYEMERTHVHEPKRVGGKRVIGIYNDALPNFINPNLNCVFHKVEDPAECMNPGINIISLNEYKKSQGKGKN